MCSKLGKVSTTTRTRRPYAARVPREVRREQLLDAAIAIIDRDGYGGVSIDAIAREVGVTRPVVYGVFDGLGPLLSALLDRQESRALGQLERAFAEASDAGSLEEVVVGTATRMIDAVTSDPRTWRPILLAPHGTPSPVRERIDRDRDGVRRRVAELAGLALGRDADGADVELLSHAVVAVLEHFGRLLLEDPDRFGTDRLVAGVRAVLTLVERPAPRE
jgi:AcrR family transcriptional regulator